MNFDEANELFADETLQSMQMARVVGGLGPLPTGPILWKALVTFISTLADIVAIQKAITGKEGATIAPDQSFILTQDSTGIKIEGHGCSFNGELNGNGQLEIHFGPSPTPTPLPKN